MRTWQLHIQKRRSQVSTFYFLLIISVVYISNDIPLPGYPSEIPCIPSTLYFLPFCLYEGASPTTPSCPKVPASSYAGASNLQSTKGLPTHWCQIRPSCVTYVCRAMASSMYTYVGGLVPRVLSSPVSWYCSSFGVAIPFSFFRPSQLFRWGPWAQN